MEKKKKGEGTGSPKRKRRLLAEQMQIIMDSGLDGQLVESTIRLIFKITASGLLWYWVFSYVEISREIPLLEYMFIISDK